MRLVVIELDQAQTEILYGTPLGTFYYIRTYTVETSENRTVRFIYPDPNASSTCDKPGERTHHKARLYV